MNYLHGSGHYSLVCETTGLRWLTAFIKRTVLVSNLC